MATATAMYHSGKNPLRKVTRDSEGVDIVKGDRRRRLQFGNTAWAFAPAQLLHATGDGPG
jgi:hypothetical protein